MAGVTYIAQKRLLIGGEYRLPGEEVPEAIDWMNVDAYINRGMIAVVPSEGSADIEPRSQGGLRDAGGTPKAKQSRRQRLIPQRFVRDEADEELIESEDDEDTPPSDDDPSGFDYQGLSVDEVQSAYDEGLLTIEEIDEFEDERAKGRRKGIDEWLDSLEEDEESEEA